MINPVTQVLTTETDSDRFRMQLANAQADLQRHIFALSKLQAGFMVSRVEVSGIRDNLRAAEAHIDELRVHAADRETEIARLHKTYADLSKVHNQMRASRSWRIATAVSMAGRFFLPRRS